MPATRTAGAVHRPSHRNRRGWAGGHRRRRTATCARCARTGHGRWPRACAATRAGIALRWHRVEARYRCARPPCARWRGTEGPAPAAAGPGPRAGRPVATSGGSTTGNSTCSSTTGGAASALRRPLPRSHGSHSRAVSSSTSSRTPSSPHRPHSASRASRAMPSLRALRSPLLLVPRCSCLSSFFSSSACSIGFQRVTGGSGAAAGLHRRGSLPDENRRCPPAYRRRSLPGCWPGRWSVLRRFPRRRCHGRWACPWLVRARRLCPAHAPVRRPAAVRAQQQGQRRCRRQQPLAQAAQGDLHIPGFHLRAPVQVQAKARTDEERADQHRGQPARR